MMETAPRANYREIGGPDGHLANLRPFKGNTMSADTNETTPYGLGFVTPSGREPEWVKDRFRRDRDNYGLAYIVWSYGTIIAWTIEEGYRNIPDAHYSKTTTMQQGKCLAWLKGTDLDRFSKKGLDTCGRII